MRLLCTGFLRISRYLYFIRKSSPPSVSSSIVKGGVLDLFRIFKSETRISTSPVGMFGFFDSRSITVPVTWMTNSRPKCEAVSIISLEVRSSSKINRSEEHTSELQSRPHLVCRLLLEKKKK